MTKTENKGGQAPLIGFRVPMDVHDFLKHKAARELSSIQDIARRAIAKLLRDEDGFGKDAA